MAACGKGTASGSPDRARVANSSTQRSLTQHPAGSRLAAPTLSGKAINGDLLELADLRGKVIVLNM
ncbi:hypothetical protein [Streptomyces sp. 3213.3]|uniref:hypothetical protein n=1 Tax=Streptomyces sp. 3213.3 TaxID=1855348 RepID=UPI00190EF164|nr:hypothetical protein [Streptomyces sp. 3213.3]